MLEPPPLGTRSKSDAGFTEHLRAFAATGLEYLGARFQLVGIESKEASAHYLKIIGLAFVALVAVLFGYFFLLAAVVFLVAHLFQVDWMWVMLGCGLLHIGGAALCLWIASRKLKLPMFAATLNEFKKDQEWLSNQKPY